MILATLNHRIFHILLFIALPVLLVAGCSGGSGGGAPTGGIIARLAWQETARTAKTVAAAPAGVATVRVTVSGAGMADIQSDFVAGAGSGTITGIPVGSGRTFTVRGLTAGGGIIYQAVVNNITISQGQSTDLGTVTMLVQVAPAAPTGLAATVNSTSRIDLAWSDTDMLETGFTIERKTGAAGTWAQLATVAANTAGYSDAGLNPATTYYYRVKATNGAGDSAWSGESSAATNSPVIRLAKTGQTTSYAAGDDGDLEKGVAWPTPRFTDNTDGTVTDNLTGLVWLKNANCTDTVGGIAKTANSGLLVWADALTWSNALASGKCGLSDGSTVGQWRLPNIVELESLVDAERYNPALPSGHPFSNVQSDYYWSSSSYAGNTTGAWSVGVGDGYVYVGNKGNFYYVWPVRAGQ